MIDNPQIGRIPQFALQLVIFCIFYFEFIRKRALKCCESAGLCFKFYQSLLYTFETCHFFIDIELLRFLYKLTSLSSYAV